MAKKIIILNGSPRKNGNTSALTVRFRQGAEEAGNEVMEFHLQQVLCGWVTQPGDIEGKPELTQAYELGKSIR